jgi:PAS domain S-box-containing protein
VIIIRSVTYPLTRLHKGTEIIAEGNLDYKTNIRTPDEIGQLSNAFDSMTENLQKITVSRDELRKEIEERKRAEEALRKSEMELKEAQRVGHLGSWDLNVVTGDLQWSDECYCIYGFRPQEFTPTYEKFRSMVHPEDLGFVQEQVDAALNKDKHYDVDFRFVRPNGEIGWIHCEGEVTRDAEGKPLRFFGTQIDITERKRAEEALRKSEGKYRNLVESISDVVYAIDSSGVLTYISPVIKNMSGYEPDELIGRKFLEFVHKEDQDLLMRRFSELREGIVKHSDYRLIGKQGDIKWVRTLTNPIIEEGGFVGARGVLIDITERKQMEEALQFTRFSLDNSADTMACISHDGRFIDVNNAFCRSSGYSREELLSITVHDIDPDYSAEIWPEFWKKLKQSGSLTFESCHRTKEGKVFPVEITATFFEHNGKEYHCGFAHDITERKRAEEALRVSLEKYRIFFESFPLGITISDKSGKIIEGNRQSEQLLGITREAHAQRRIDSKEWQIIRKDGTPMPVDEYASTRALRENRLIENVEMGIVKDKGEITWINVTAAPIPLEGYGVAIAYGDITERKKAEEELRFHGEIMKNMSEGVYLVRLSDGLIVYTNPKFERMFGYEAGEMIGKSVTIVNAPTAKSPEETAREIIEVLNRTGVWYGEVNNIKKDGTPFWCYAGCSLFEHPEYGKVIVAVHTDITERKRAEEALRGSEQRHRTILQTAMDGFWLLDAEGRLLEVNETYCRMSGYSAQELLAMRIPDLEAAEAYGDTAAHIQKIMAQGEDRFESRHRRKDGSIFDVEVSVQYRTAKGGWLVAFLQDITERKRTEEALRDSLTEKEVLLREVHHRVKNNLAAIIGLINMGQTEIKDAATATLMKELESRIRAMLLIHEGLYRSENLARIAFQGYLETLLSHLHSSFASQGAVRFSVAADVELGLDAAPSPAG